MKYEGFLKLIKELCDQDKDYSYRGQYDEKAAKNSWDRGRYNLEDKDTEPQLSVKWETGGISGGSCWDSSNPQPYSSSEPEGELTILDALLEEINPNITFIQYKNLYNKLINSDTDSVGEYYGNCTDYGIKFIRVKELYEYMDEKGWLEK